MNPYNHDAIENKLDVRLVDCFIEQNQSNEWLPLSAVAAWVFQTNKPNGLQIRYCQGKIVSIMGMLWTSEVEKSFIEKDRSEVNRYEYVYRCNDRSLLNKRRARCSDIKNQVDSVFTDSSPSSTSL